MKKIIKLLLVLIIMILSVRVSYAHSKTCEIYNGKYYGKDAHEVDKVQYEIECLPHSCEIVGNTYFGKNGNIVSYEAYKKECSATVIDSPGTGSSISPIYLFFIFLGSGLIITTFILLKKSKMSYNQ